jgi:hypothetical protein
MFKTKKVEKRRGIFVTMMICQNSNPSESKWGKYAPEDSACENWCEVGAGAAAILCSDCTQRSLQNMSSKNISPDSLL